MATDVNESPTVMGANEEDSFDENASVDGPDDGDDATVLGSYTKSDLMT